MVKAAAGKSSRVFPVASMNARIASYGFVR
jgi:hypothetical protein